MTLTRRLVSGTLLVLGAFVLLTVAALDRRLRVHLRDDIAAELTRQARLVGAQWKPGLDADSLADEAAAALSHRVTLVRPDGSVAGDSEFDAPALGRLENHATRPEIASATSAEAGVSVRLSPSEGGEQMYAAVRTALGVARVSVSVRSQEILVDRMQRDVLLVALAGTVLALVLSVIFARSVTRPILELRDDARAIAAGDLTRRPSLAAPGEVGELAAAFHRLAEQLSARLAALEADDALFRALTESLNEGTVALDATRRVIHVNEHAQRLLGVAAEPPYAADLLPRDRILREALDAAFRGEPTDTIELALRDRIVLLTARPLAGGGAVLALLDITPMRRLETVRRDFVANVSHELKTPITVIGGFAETLADESLADEQRRRFAEMIVGNTRRMQRLVDDLLDLSRIESGGWTPNPAPLDLHTAAEEALTPCRERAESHGVRLAVDLAPDARVVWADPTAVRQILANLVDNAVRHTAQGSVTIFSRRRGQSVEFGVRDTGSGIAPEHRPRIFERFYRVDAGRSREEGGTGLGLAIVRHLVEAHGGDVWAESELGAGTTITVRMPDHAERDRVDTR